MDWDGRRRVVKVLTSAESPRLARSFVFSVRLLEVVVRRSVRDGPVDLV